MRLKGRRDFEQVRQAGRRLVRGCVIANWLEGADGAGTQLGVITGGRLGKAVVRSRARRLLREVFRLHQTELRRPVTLILVGRASIVGRKLAEVERDYLSVMRTAGLLRAER